MSCCAAWGTDVGSSPRVRGKRADRCAGQPRVGLIPARAGKTMCEGLSRGTARAHPRACGENGCPGWSICGLVGSSPRVRGKLPRALDVRVFLGLIPARAGKTHVGDGAGENLGAHPRACGENIVSYAAVILLCGSSPRVRGKLRGRVGTHLHAGLIPARAGKTPVKGGGHWMNPAHPRACGENYPDVGIQVVRVGSSPRVRGKLHTMYFLHSTDGLIPARAGKTSASRSAPSKTKAHPRACGENDALAEGSSIGAGSSPRVRGKHRVGGLLGHDAGLIPARAGKTR